MTIVQRATAPTPKFFKVLRNIGLVLLAVSGSIIASPVVLPATIVTIAGYASVAAGVLSAVSQITVDDDAKREQGIIRHLLLDNQNTNNDGIR